MTQFLPPNLLSLFFPRDPLPFKPPPKRKKCPKAKRYTGVSQYLDIFEEPKDEPPVIYETRFERRERKRREKQERERQVLEERKRKWDPKNDVNCTTDPYKTLFIARLSYETTESRLKHEFEIFGPIKTIRIVTDKITGKNRGYAFIEYEHTRDMHAAYKHMDGKKIDGRRIIVDAERGRVEADWLPRYLGGGLGGHRRSDRTKRSDRSDFESHPIPNNHERGDYDISSRRRGSKSKSRSRSRKRTYEERGVDDDRSERHRSRSKRDQETKKRHKDDDRSKHDRDRRHY